MEIRYTKRFLKDLSKIPLKQREVIEVLIFEELRLANSLRSIPNIKKLSIDPYYRIRVGEFRIGIEKRNNYILVRRVLSRKEIYKYFP